MSQDQSFFPVDQAQERARILSDLESKSINFAGVTEDEHQFLFKLKSVSGEKLSLELVAPVSRALRSGEKIELLFGMPDGMYSTRTTIEQPSNDGAVCTLGAQVFRLQRRNNFRTPLPPNYKIAFKLTSLQTKQVAGSPSFYPLDLSASGMRIKWNLKDMPAPKAGDRITGIFSLPNGKQIELFGSVKNVSNDPSGAQLGLEFENMQLRDEQALLFFCMQVHRDQLPVVR